MDAKEKKLEALRLRANDALKRGEVDHKDIDTTDMQKLVEDLRLYQVELELQNEELRNTQATLVASENRLNDLFQNAPVSYVIVDKMCNILSCNQTFADFVGAEVGGSLKGQRLPLYIVEIDRRRLVDFTAGIFEESNADTTLENVRFESVAGCRYVNFFGARDSSESEACRLVMVDVTDQQEAQMARLRAEGIMSTAVENIPLGLFVADSNYHVTVWNRRIAEMTGMPSDKILGKSFIEVFELEEGHALREAYTKVIEKAEPFSIENYHAGSYEKQAPARIYDVSAAPIRLDSKTVSGIVAVISDVTQRHDAMMSRNQMAAIVESSDDAILSKTLDGLILHWNASAERLYGWTAEEAVGKTVKEVFSKTPASEFDEVLEKVSRGESIRHYQTRRNHKDGSMIDISLSVSPVRDSRGKIVAAASISRDITEWLETLQALKESEERFRAIALNAPDVIIQADLHGRILFSNRSLNNTDDDKSITGRIISELFASPDSDNLMRDYAAVFRKDQLLSGEYKTTGASPRVYMVRMAPVRAGEQDTTGLLLLRDVTDQRRMEKEFEKAQRAHGLIRLAGGVAHDFNNLLMTIMGYAELGNEDSSDGSDLKLYFEEIEKAGERASRLSQQMLAYSGGGSFQLKRSDLNETILEIKGLIFSSVSRKAHVHLDLVRQLPEVFIDKHQMQQVVLSLIENASEALGDQAGDITIRTQVMRWAPNDSGAGVASEWVALEVEDTGQGIAAKDMEQIFEPFFTTRFTGRGLGLSAAHGIINSHSGHIEVESEPGKGAFFRVLIPVAERVEKKAAVTLADRGGEENPMARKTIIIVDDEESLRRLAARILSSAGFQTSEAATGMEALTIIRNEEPDCVLLDMTMPEMSGEEVMTIIQDEYPRLPVVLISGYNATHLAARLEGLQPDAVLQKPFQKSMLLETVSNAILDKNP